ncbi:hypothetical protein RvY_02982-2 [Ramazzottius varieornatus]|uniref:Uncharacterized protein n=1 Tax=Ramazzottius varieornatus TaxID=947166 RepID=A0A1D1US73_RAMVA|nr:hypothetical protein RvY_02982-2 [Ramazzottius varieornatus]
MNLYRSWLRFSCVYIFQIHFQLIIQTYFSSLIFVPHVEARSGPLSDPDDYGIVTSAPAVKTTTEANMTAVASKFRDAFSRNRGARREEVLSALESGFKPVKLSLKRDPRAEEVTFGDGYNLGYVPAAGEKGTFIASTGSSGTSKVLSVSASSKDSAPLSAVSAFDELDGQPSDSGYNQNGVDSGWSKVNYKGSSGKYAKAGYTAAASTYGDSYGGWGGDSYGGRGGYGGGSYGGDDSYGGGPSYGGWGGDGQDNTVSGQTGYSSVVMSQQN